MPLRQATCSLASWSGGRRRDFSILMGLLTEPRSGDGGTPRKLRTPYPYLASENAAYITGATLVVDDGFTTRADAGENLETFAE